MEREKINAFKALGYFNDNLDTLAYFTIDIFDTPVIYKNFDILISARKSDGAILNEYTRCIITITDENNVPILYSPKISSNFNGGTVIQNVTIMDTGKFVINIEGWGDVVDSKLITVTTSENEFFNLKIQADSYFENYVTGIPVTFYAVDINENIATTFNDSFTISVDEGTLTPSILNGFINGETTVNFIFSNQGIITLSFSFMNTKIWNKKFYIGNFSKTFPLPYINDFENDTQGWIIGDKNSSALWELGSPTIFPSVILSGNKCLATGIDNNYRNLTYSYVITPSLDLTGSTYPLAEFYHIIDLELPDEQNNWDGGIIEYSLDSGVTWNNLFDTYLLPHIEDTITLISGNVLAGKTAFCKNNYDSDIVWEKILIDLNIFKNNTIKFKFSFGSDQLENKNGWFIDDFKIYDTSFDSMLNSYISIVENPQPQSDYSLPVLNIHINDSYNVVNKIGLYYFTSSSGIENLSFVDSRVINYNNTLNDTLFLNLPYTLSNENFYYYFKIVNFTNSIFYLLKNKITYNEPTVLSEMFNYPPPNIKISTPFNGQHVIDTTIPVIGRLENFKTGDTVKVLVNSETEYIAEFDEIDSKLFYCTATIPGNSDGDTLTIYATDLAGYYTTKTIVLYYKGHDTTIKIFYSDSAMPIIIADSDAVITNIIFGSLTSGTAPSSAKIIMNNIENDTIELEIEFADTSAPISLVIKSSENQEVRNKILINETAENSVRKFSNQSDYEAGLKTVREFNFTMNGESFNGSSNFKNITLKFSIPQQLEDKYNSIYLFNETTNLWEDLGGLVTKYNNTIEARLNHFSIYGIFRADNFSMPTDNLDNVLVYPNPFKPYDGNTATGLTFVNGQDGTGIYINGLMENSTLKIFTITGELVFESVTPAGTGVVQWNVKNKDSEDIASGVYVLLVKNAGHKITKKIFIVK